MSIRNRLLLLSVPSIVFLVPGILLLGSHLTGFGLTLVAGGLGWGLVGWLFGIYFAATSRAWGWLILVILTGALGTIIYALFGAENSRTRSSYR